MYGSEHAGSSAIGVGRLYQDSEIVDPAGEPGAGACEQVLAAYTTGPAARVIPFVLLGPCVLLGIALTAYTVLDSGAQWPFTLFWWAFTSANGYHWLLHRAYRLELTPTALRWMAPLRTARVPLPDVVLVSRFRIGWPMAAIEFAGNRNVSVTRGPGFSSFTEQMLCTAPHIAVKVGARPRLLDRPGRRRGCRGA